VIIGVTAWHEEPINKKHDREGFDCGEAALNEILRRYAGKSHELGGAKTFLAIDDNDNKTILGFYSLAPASVDYARTPEIIRRGLARHDVPGFRLARLAVDRRQQGQGIGGQLLHSAGRRCPVGLGGGWRRRAGNRREDRKSGGVVCQLRRCATT
jgi:GNAT superfamily N-acetyltransferase